jgi:hypothetical protein
MHMPDNEPERLPKNIIGSTNQHHTAMKIIIVGWVPADPKVNFRDREMRVLYSTHPIYAEGTRFDFGYLRAASEKGYMIQILPN